MIKRNEYQKLIEQNRARWFLLSYDAGAEIKSEKFNDNNQKEEIKYRKYGTDDFRKVIIRTLRVQKVEEMDEPVETAIFFQDPRENLPVDEKVNYWENEFDKYEKDFYFIITAVAQDSKGRPYFGQRPNTTLQISFQTLLSDVLKEEKNRKTSF